MIAALASEVVIHPMDTIVTRMQSARYTQIYKHVNGTISRSLFTGLYQGFGPTLIAGTIGSAAFFTTYEATKSAFEDAQAAGYFPGVPRPVGHIASSAVAELLASAVLNPAEVLKQNAQVLQPKAGESPTIEMLRRLRGRPSALWAGYTTLVASQMPGICLTFALYETFKESLLQKQSGSETGSQLQAIVLSACTAGAFASLPFVPIDVVKTRMRLAVGERTTDIQQSPKGGKGLSTRVSAFSVAGNILCKEGIAGLFRGSVMTCVAGVVGSGLYIGCYEGSKLYLFAQT
ncbi:unnamed protein product [Penicillium salamii]|nr:unnamed protein product [Penicillium salamii]CAG7999528.1 unnamed protein product [Penicillium salamii]CAG8285301.1 unnamed protein product [Penicillium salamii]